MEERSKIDAIREDSFSVAGFEYVRKSTMIGGIPSESEKGK